MCLPKDNDVCICERVCVCNCFASLKSGLGWAPASFPCLLPFTRVSAEICQSPSRMVPRVVLRVIEPRQPFSMGRISGSPFSCSSVKVFVLVLLAPHSLETIVKGFHLGTRYWPTQLGIASAEILSLSQGCCIISNRSLTKDSAVLLTVLS